MNMIEVKNVTMKFRLANDKIQSLKEYFIALVTKKLKYKELCVFSNLSFDIKKGEVVGIIGRNGAGKSTLLKIISGVLAPTEGDVKNHGNIVPMLELGSGFDIELSGRENIYLNGSILGYSKKFLEEKFDEILEFSELGEFIEEPIRNYSSGMLMRLAFSIATIVHPEILIVDEILAVGDEAFQRKSKRKMLELMGGGTTVLFVSHSIDQIKEMCSRVIWIENGQIQKDGDAKEVCDAYQKFLNPEQNVYQDQKASLRNIDAYKYLMDVLIVYNRDELSYYTALARKEQLLAGNMCAQELCVLDLNMEVLKQYRLFLFVNCDVETIKEYIEGIEKRHKVYLAECHFEQEIQAWNENCDKIDIITNDRNIADGNKQIFYIPVPLTERLQQIVAWVKYDRDILPYKKMEEIEGEQELINYNRAVQEWRKHRSDGKRVGVICDSSLDKNIFSEERASLQDKSFVTKIIFNNDLEEIVRAIAKVDFVLDKSNERLMQQIIQMISEMLGVPYCKHWSNIVLQNSIDNIHIKDLVDFSTIKTGAQFAEFIRTRVNTAIVYLFKNLTELDNNPTILRRINMDLKEKKDVTVFVTSLQDSEASSVSDCISVINRGIKYVLGGFDIVVAVNEEEFPFIITYPNIKKRIYYVSHWGPDAYDYGDFNRIKMNQTYLPCLQVEFWTDTKEVSEWLQERYHQESIII